MVDPITLIPTAIQGYNWIRMWHEKQANPPHLPDNALLLFKRFKEAYDTKNIIKLGFTLSDNYRGDLNGVSTKQEYLSSLKRVFDSLPLLSPCLSINVYSIIENRNDVVSAIIDTQSKTSFLGIPLTNYDSTPIRCEIRPEQGLWVITKMFIEWRLIS
ncbi:hypothetical protein [Planktothrix mougeotii]|uniref:SnoaL-like domain-containing protein n=1 Tax=Planktothrix mougeotii LEGE 06226 TaxID=1828728 RepID=A0ABR9UAY3_9CYAN|nr:hypothetical protein [Planktothrix mougeotii]MBE9143618.1 hypothetical protein [Planktothrix mougeotii LEGE 06226]